MMMETIAEHSCYISLFHESVEEAEQTRIYSLSYQKAVDTIKTLSKQDPEKCSAIEGICHYASMVLDENNGHLSTWLVARIIKYLIYRTKIEHIGRLKADLGHGIEDRAPRNIDVSTGSGISHRKADSESEYALTGKASAPLHGDAVPLDEPNLYVVLSGFRDPDLPAELLHVGVPLSCILEVRTSGPERYIMYCDTGEKDSTLEDGSRFPQDYHIEGKNALLKFWTVTHQRFANLSAYPAYSDIAVLTFYLPSLPETSNITEKESLKRDMYDKALLILRHLNDLRRQHAEYLGCMKLEKRIADKDEKMDTKIYEDALKDIPNEYINAPLILSAMLLQVESNLAGFPSKCTPDDTRFSDTRHVNSSTIAERIPVSIVRDKLILLDRKYELSDEYISINCPLLFALTDTKETLLPGYLFKNVWRTRSYERPSLDEYEDVELLSGRVFLQVVHECFQSFDRFAARRLSSIRTPVGLWEFCKYIVGEEENWIKRRGRETRRSRATDLTGRFTKKSIEMKEETIIFEDECFMLPDSLKARYLKERIGGRKVTRQKRNEAPNSESESSDGALTNGKTSMTEKKSDPKIDDVDTSFLPAKQILSFGCAEEEESRDVLGYDLERLRVQVIHHSKKFPLADTSVRVELEDWLHGDFSLRVAVTLQCCTLRLSSRVGHHQSPDTFHLTTKRGAVLSFCRNVQELVQNSFDCQRQNLAFDFRASWPSGLLIEPTIGDSTKNPFCIRQSYVPKCPGRAGAAREVCRNFLRNGTVLKYLDDNTVVILRPNGVIVTCMDFDEPRSHDEFIRQTAETTLKELRRNGSRQSGMAEHGEKVIGSTESHFDGSIVDIQPTKQHVLNRGDPLIMEMFVTGKVLRYSVVNYDGRHYEMLNDLLVSEHDRLLVRTISDYEVGEMFTRRADGTDTLLRSNGELIVTFSDGTRIITNYVIEKESITCEWSQDELQRYFGFMTKETKEYNDGFVSVLLTFRVEHKDYAIVSYDQSAVGYTLSMPDDLHVSVSGRGHYEVSIEDELNLKTRDDRVLLTEMCATCGGKSSTTLKFWDFVQTSSRTILTTTDIFGNALEVKSDGSTSFHLETDLCVEGGHERNDDDDDVPEHNGERRNSEEQRAKSQARIHRKHERYCKMLKFPARSQYRIFAMNRDLTAREYLHRSVRREQEVAAVFGDETSMIQYPISRRPELRRLITFVPVEPKLRSKELSYQYRISSDKRMDYQRSKLLRSTSSPYNWLFPFGKRNQVVPEKMQNEVLTKRNELSLPKLLRVRIFFGIKEADRNILIDMQRAMGLYWIFVFRDGDKCRLFCATGPSRACEVENDYKSSEEEELRELALGVRKSIDVETYVRSLRGKLIKVSTEAVRQSSRLAELLQQRGSMKEEYEWYKQCMRKRIIMPYFQTIANSCYSLMKDLVNEAI
ncbi:hypothetical protein X777_09491 [Ooceraea biroi]|uniref:Uncharacterized protein n=1 Tax=Ooceraea biroi TaxID=2015173 RepID=A0A026W6Q0_OOCBI|nr:hypothetical protein X777_09491 [Ooceraea biroi]